MACSADMSQRALVGVLPIYFDCNETRLVTQVNFDMWRLFITIVTLQVTTVNYCVRLTYQSKTRGNTEHPARFACQLSGFGLARRLFCYKPVD